MLVQKDSPQRHGVHRGLFILTQQNDTCWVKELNPLAIVTEIAAIDWIDLFHLSISPDK